MLESRFSVFYGGYVLGASSLILFISSGVRLTVGVLVKPVIAGFGWSRSAVSFAVLLNTVVSAISVIVVGGGLWAYLGGAIFDQSGSYDLAFVISAIMAFLAVVCTLLMEETRHPAR